MKNYFTLAPVFTDNMVFQVNKPIKIFGTCKKNIEIIVKLLDQEVAFKTKSEVFMIELEAIPLQDSAFSVTISAKKQKEVLYNCVIGDVYLFLGGMNISMPLRNSFHEEDYCDYNVRFYDTLKDDDNWRVSGKSNFEDLSALSYLFAKNLHETVKSPIGIITCTHNDAKIFSWMSLSDIDSNKEIKHITSTFQDIEKVPMYSLMKRKIIPLCLKAVVIYQGENDYSYYSIYEYALKTIIKCLRFDYNDIKLPFVIIQIAGYNHPEADDYSLSMIRVSQASVLDDRNYVYLVSAVDLGEIDSINPKKKLVLSKRLANLVLEKMFKIGKNMSSPIFYSYQVNPKAIYIYTQNNYLNLVSRSNQYLGFSYSENGSDFFPVIKVSITNNQIIISHDKPIKEIRYGMKKYPVCDIYSSNSLPLLPFNIKLL
jgi:sialate O-acetylesterase